jgi:hypothetical protein
VIASLREPADFAGLPIVEGGPSLETYAGAVRTVTFAPPRFAVEAARHGGVTACSRCSSAGLAQVNLTGNGVARNYSLLSPDCTDAVASRR